MNSVFVKEQAMHVLPGGPPLTGMASDLRTIDLIVSLALFIGARTVVEAGTFAGYTSLSLARALTDAGLGSHVWTADVHDPYPNGIEGQAVAPLGLTESVTIFHGDFANMLADVPGEIDLAYIDASSTERPNMRREHFDAVWPRMRLGGLVLIDDCAWAGGRWFRDQATLYLPQRRGLAICRKEAP